MNAHSLARFYRVVTGSLGPRSSYISLSVFFLPWRMFAVPLLSHASNVEGSVSDGAAPLQQQSSSPV
jgi:hypothetical protein